MTEHKGQVVGYVRVSSADQHTDRQDLGNVDRIFEDKLSGKDRNRPALEEMLKYVRDGDTVRVHSMDRLARSLSDLVSLVSELTTSGIAVEFAKEQLVFKPGANDPYAEFQMHILGSVAQLERSLIRERQREGIRAAKLKGVYKGRKPALNAEQIEEVRERIAAGVPKAIVARELNVSRQTIYKVLAEGREHAA